MDGFEQKVIRSFKAVKKDILSVQDQVLSLAERQEKFEATLEELKKNGKNVVKKK